MKLATLIAAFIPYEQGERYAHGEHIEVPLIAVVGGILWLELMIWYIRKVRKDKRKRGARRQD